MSMKIQFNWHVSFSAFTTEKTTTAQHRHNSRHDENIVLANSMSTSKWKKMSALACSRQEYQLFVCCQKNEYSATTAGTHGSCIF